MGGGRVTERLCEVGIKMTKLRGHIGTLGQQHERIHEFNEGGEEWGDTDFPFWLTIPQQRTESILEEEFERLGGRVEWSTCLESLEPMESFAGSDDEPQGIPYQMAIAKRTSKTEEKTEIIQCRWVIGCDGGRSFTRDQANLKLHRESSDAFFWLADVELGTQRAKDMFKEDEGNVFVHPEGAMGILPLGEDDLFRIICHETSRSNPSTSPDLRESPDITKSFIDESVQKRCGININTQRMTWSSIFRVSYGVSNAYDNGGIFIAGDAAHVHSPLGGQGMNYGIQDATNLIWKMAWAKRIIESSSSPPSNTNTNTKIIDTILKSYCSERREAALKMIKGNALATKGVVSTNPILRHIREIVMKRIFGGKRFKYMTSQSLSMLNLQYDSTKSSILFTTTATASRENKCIPICTGSRRDKNKNQGEWKPGSRLPNFTTSNGEKIYSQIGRRRHTLLVIHGSTDAEDFSTQQTTTSTFVSTSAITGPGGIPIIHTSPCYDVTNENENENGNNNQQKMMKQQKMKIHVHVNVPQCVLLIRPDLYIAAIGDDMDMIFRQVVNLLGTKATDVM